MKIHKCYKLFAQAPIPQYPNFKTLMASKLVNGIAYDTYHFQSLINGIPCVVNYSVVQNTKVDYKSIATALFEKHYVEKGKQTG